MSESLKPGLAVDKSGGPVVDPTANVIALNEAANKRQDDLRDLTNRFHDEQIKRLEGIVELRAKIAEMRAEHAKEIRTLESDRLDKIRQVDVQAATLAADRALIAIQTLDRTTQAAAETLRSMVADTAATVATQTAATAAQQNERIAALEKSSYTGLGKQAVADPQMAELVAAVNKLMVTSSMNAGKSEGLSMGAAVLLGIVSLAGALIGIGGALYGVLKP